MKEKASKIEKLLNENEITTRIEENLNQTIISKNTHNNVVITVGKISEATLREIAERIDKNNEEIERLRGLLPKTM